MRTKRVLKIGGIVLALCVALGGAALGAILWSIHESVQEQCAIAQEAHRRPGDDSAALVEFMKSDAHSLRERSRAIWTLGRLRDPKSLPALESVYTGELCQHDKFLCQYELEKAIKLCGGAPRPPRKTRH